jgi:predicted permease
MHSHIISPSSGLDNGLYPALLQVFAIILLGYLTGALNLISKSQSDGLHLFVGYLSLPALLFNALATVDMTSINWIFLTSIFFSKLIIFVAAIGITFMVMRPLNFGMAAIFAIFVSQSNDFALGYPILEAIYSTSHPDYLRYIYLIAPVSLCILNPIAFLMLETNETFFYKRKRKEEESLLINESTASTSATSCDDELTSLEDLIDKPKSFDGRNPDGKSKFQLLKTVLFSTLSNPVVIMTFAGIASNLCFNGKLPSLIKPIFTSLANTFGALSLFLLGMTMVNKIKNITISSIIIIFVLIIAKNVVYPLMVREMVLHIGDSFTTTSNSTEIEDLSSFGFIYGTFPAAPAVFIYMMRYESLQNDYIAPALVFCTFTSAPLMMLSGKMISLQQNSTAQSFEETECRTAYGFSMLTWFCCLWVLYILIATGRFLKKPQFYTFALILSQMAVSLVHLIWSTLTKDPLNTPVQAGYVYVVLTLFTALLSRCLVVSILLSIIGKMQKFSVDEGNSCQRFIFKLANSSLFTNLIGFALPALTTGLCLFFNGIPSKQNMMISLGMPQILITTLLLGIIITFTLFTLIIFIKTKYCNSHVNILTLMSNNDNEVVKISETSSHLDADPSNNSILLDNEVNEENDSVQLMPNSTNDYGLFILLIQNF